MFTGREELSSGYFSTWIDLKISDILWLLEFRTVHILICLGINCGK